MPVVELGEQEMRPDRGRGEGGFVAAGGDAAVPVSERVRDFREVELQLTEEAARQEAARCLECGICSECHLCVRGMQGGSDRSSAGGPRGEIDVGSVILAPGHSLYDPKLSPELGYGRYPNVLTSMEYERMLSASGPYGGHVTRPSDRVEPRKIAFLQCVGSRNKDNDYCSSVCCMSATKEAIMAKEHLPGSEFAIFQMDMRAFGKDFERYTTGREGKGDPVHPLPDLPLGRGGPPEPGTSHRVPGRRGGSAIREERSSDMVSCRSGCSRAAKPGSIGRRGRA